MSAIATCTYGSACIQRACAAPNPGKVVAPRTGCSGGCFELVADRAVGGCRLEEMIGINRLRCARESIDALGHQRDGHEARMQEGALAEDVVRIGSLASHEERGRADRPAGRDEGLRMHADPARRRIGAASIEPDAVERAHAAVRVREGPRPRARDKRRAARERLGNRRHQHRLLGVGRAAHAAIADVPAALDVATDCADAQSQRLRAAAQHVVVLVGLDRP